jgi:PIN domain nuclease of toxin-antitoxin system
MQRAIIDTHALIWYLYDDPRLSERARALIESAVLDGDQVSVSAITLAEIVYLAERGRIDRHALGRVLAAIEPESMFRESPLDRAVVTVMTTIDRNEVPDLPDRIIAATAKFHRVPLISRDRRIQASAVETIW